jgi:nitroreductase
LSQPTSTEPGTDIVQYWKQQLQWRYATKAYDPDGKITPQQWKVIQDSIQLAPSSYGLQPYKAVVITDLETRKHLREAGYGQPQFTDASYVVVFAAKQTMSEQDVDAFIKLTADTRKMPAEALKQYRDVIVGDLVHGPRSKHIPEWTARQAYIALGFMLAAAALQKVDASPMEGFDPDAFTKILGLDKIGYKATVCCAIGHRGQGDWLAPLAKVRWPEEQLFIKK